MPKLWINLSVFFGILFSSNLYSQDFYVSHRNCFGNKGAISLMDSDYLQKLQAAIDCMVGCKAPGFTVRTFSGKHLSSKKLKGYSLVINFWNIHCKPCVAEMPALNKVRKIYRKEKIVFLAATTDNEKTTLMFLKKHPFLFEQVSNGNYFMKKVFLAGEIFPYTIFINRKGRIAKILIGGSLHNKETINQYKTIIKQCL